MMQEFTITENHVKLYKRLQLEIDSAFWYSYDSIATLTLESDSPSELENQVLTLIGLTDKYHIASDGYCTSKGQQVARKLVRSMKNVFNIVKDTSLLLEGNYIKYEDTPWQYDSPVLTGTPRKALRSKLDDINNRIETLNSVKSLLETELNTFKVRELSDIPADSKERLFDLLYVQVKELVEENANHVDQNELWEQIKLQLVVHTVGEQAL